MKAFILKFLKYIKWCSKGGYTQLTLSPIVYSQVLKGQRALITGGSEGIGLAIAKKFLEAGAFVVITGRNQSKLDKAKEVLHSDRVKVLQWDVSDIAHLQDHLEKAKQLLGGLDILVNNAAFLSNSYVDETFYDRTLTTNLKAAYFLCSAVADSFVQENGVQGGKIINISSINAWQSEVHPYYISKRGLNAVTEGFAKKYAPYNVIVNGIAPGYCDSSINKQDASLNAYWQDAANRRITTPQDIAELAMFLCSGAANGIIGQTIVCDGGELL